MADIVGAENYRPLFAAYFDDVDSRQAPIVPDAHDSGPELFMGQSVKIYYYDNGNPIT